MYRRREVDAVLSKTIKALRDANHLNQAEFAKRLFVTQGAVSQWENGRTAPTIDQLRAIADTFGTSVDQLLGIEKTAQQELDGQVDDLIKMCAQLTPENLGKAKSYLQYLLEREQPDKPELPADHQA